MHRSKLIFLLLSSPLLACADDIPEVPDPSTTGNDPTMGVVTVTPPTTTTITDSATDAATDSATGLDSTGSSSSGETGSSSSSGEASSSSSGSTGSTGSTGTGSTGSSSTGPEPLCGDGSQDPGEACDGADLAGYNCVTLDMIFSGGTLACADDCTFDTSGCEMCGNDLVEGVEDCDGTDLAGAACSDLGFVDGTLACAGDCTFDTSACNAEVIYPIGFCRLQFPEVIDEIEGTNVDVFGRVYIMGLTDLSGLNDPAPEVTGYVGYGPDGTDPAVDPGWVWVAGTPNPGYGPASPSYEANNDEYASTLSVPTPGSYDFAFRFSGDSGASFSYCDGQPAGNSDGYQPANAGQMTSSPPPPVNLYFSEYIEGGGNNKAVEIHNATGADVDLTGCAVRVYTNGSAVVSGTINLAGMLPTGGEYVVCNPGIVDLTNCTQTSGSLNFNGDDAVDLACSGTTFDVIGQIGLDPGTEWIVGGISTLNHTLRRNCAVTVGDTNGADAFDPSAQWTQFPQDTLGDLGQYVCP